MNGGGPGSGIWKSTDGGESWTRVKGGIFDEPLGPDRARRLPQAAEHSLCDHRRQAPLPARGRGPASPTPDEAPQGGGRGSLIVSGVNDTPDRPLPLGRRRRDLAEGEQPEPAADVLQPGAHRPQRSRDRCTTPASACHQSLDGGKSVHTDIAASTHDDVHAIWINPANSNHILIGNDGGLAVSWDQAKTWNFVPNLPVGLFYHVSVDMATPYNICGGMQDNYSWCGPSAVRGTAGIAGFTWQTMQGGDGFVGAAGSDRVPHRLQRVAGRQHGAHRSRHRRDDARSGRRPTPASRRFAGTGTRRW
jgi:hypothetical protein